MKILAIIVSPRRILGNTGRLLEEVLAGVRESGLWCAGASNRL